MITAGDDEESIIVQKALWCPSREKWMKSMEQEIELMKINNIWELVGLLKGCKAIGKKMNF